MARLQRRSPGALEGWLDYKSDALRAGPAVEVTLPRSVGAPRPATGMNISVIRFVREIAARSADQTLEETRETRKQSRIYTT